MIKRKSTLHVAVAIGALVVTWNVSMSTFGEQLGSSAGRLYWANVNVTRIPESLDLLAMGKTTYGQRCAGCHGQNGLGNGPAAAYLLTKPRNFSEAEFKLRTTMDFPTDEDLFRTITVGFPAYGMPKFAYLPEELRWGLVYYVKQLGRNSFERLVANMLAHEAFGADLDTLTSEQKAESAKKIEEILGTSVEIAAFKFEPEERVELPEATSAATANPARGKEVYFELGCNKCHGDAGHGDGPSAQELIDNNGRKIWPRDFALNGWYFKGGDRPGDIFRVLITGMAGTPMPSFDDMDPETHKDLWNLAYYIRTLVRSD